MTTGNDDAAGGEGRPLLLIGCGKMGAALLTGWLREGAVPHGVHIVDPAGAADFADRPGVTVHADSADLPAALRPETVVLAIKPQQMDAALPPLRPLARTGGRVISIAAGKDIAFIARHLGPDTPILRAMPNTPAAIGRGISVICCNRACDDGDRTVARALMACVGEAHMLDDERLFDAVTALSGSGPAYVFWLIESMAAGGIAAGLPAELAQRLALVTVAGAGQLALEADQPPEVLRRNVTSPGGVTEEALHILMHEGKGLKPLMGAAIAAGVARGRALAE